MIAATYDRLLCHFIWIAESFVIGIINWTKASQSSAKRVPKLIHSGLQILNEPTNRMKL
ncbi:MAG: hypothetical protein ACI8RD_004143 [Bacillariaceae sp.]|jgi:hypothetical protein